MIPERFWTKVNRNGPIFNGLPCWEWIGRVDKDGYGRFKYDGSDKAAHRYAYINLSGEIPDGKQLDHLCRNRRCVNPVHLEPVISRENIMRGQTLARINLEKTHCKRGHEFNFENTYLIYYPDGRYKGRNCKMCKAQEQRDRLEKKKGRI